MKESLTMHELFELRQYYDSQVSYCLQNRSPNHDHLIYKVEAINKEIERRANLMFDNITE